jgi:Flp pilus assembly protein TadG
VFAAAEGGATVVEFALVAPVLILVLIGCLDFARALNAYVTVTNASREGARYATLHPTAMQADVRDYVATRIAPLSADPAVLFVGLSPYSATDGRWSVAAPRPGNTTVTVRYRWDAATGLIGSFFSAASGSSTFEVSSTMESIQ